jgi:hypothetical protein
MLVADDAILPHSAGKTSPWAGSRDWARDFSRKAVDSGALRSNPFEAGIEIIMVEP